MFERRGTTAQASFTVDLERVASSAGRRCLGAAPFRVHPAGAITHLNAPGRAASAAPLREGSRDKVRLGVGRGARIALYGLTAHALTAGAGRTSITHAIAEPPVRVIDLGELARLDEQELVDPRRGSPPCLLRFPGAPVDRPSRIQLAKSLEPDSSAGLILKTAVPSPPLPFSWRQEPR
jgi:hypothetical protein